tara:strand:+ start:1770 stop:5219 length:3450 start_codon:yes stop_codon:yes gene_type:complete
MAENKILAMVLAAKRTLAKFAVELDKATLKIVYGFGKDKIQNELVALEAEKKKNEEEGRSGSNNEIGELRQESLNSVSNPLKNPGIVPIVYQVQRINSFNLCNPFTLGINAAFPPGSPVSNGIKSVQGKLKQIQDIFRNFTLVGGTNTVNAQSIPYPIREGSMIFNVTSPEIIQPGTTVYIKQMDDETIFTNMVGVVKSNSAEAATIAPSLGTVSALDTSFGNSTDINSAFGGLSSATNLNTNSNETIEDSSFTGFDLGGLPRRARRKLRKKGLSTDLDLSATKELQNSSFDNSESGDFDQDGISNLTDVQPLKNNPNDFSQFIPKTETLSYVIEIQRFDPFDPPTQKTRTGNTVLDDADEPVLKTFSNWQFEFEKQQITDVKKLAEELESITVALRDLGVNDLIVTLNRLPSNFLGLGKLQEAMLEIALFIDNKVVPAANTLADGASTASQTLSGGITSQEVIRRSRILGDFYSKLLPIINFDLSLENIFAKQIKDINKTLRGVVPYEQLAKIVRAVQTFVKFIVKIVDFILSLLQFLNTIIKVFLLVAKVLRIVIKVIKAVTKVLPAIFLTAGIITAFQDIITKVSNGLDTAVAVLEEFSEVLDKMIGSLQFLRGWLLILAGELGKLAQTLETCDSLNGRDELDLTATIQGVFSAATGLPFPENQVRSDVKSNFEDYSSYDPYGNGESQSDNSNFGETLITTSDGSILTLPGTVWAFDENGNIVFGGDLISLSTGVNFEETRGQEFRKNLRDNLNFYTFNKFKGPSYEQLVQNLQAQSIEAYASIVEQIRQEEPTDRFGNFQEVYLGYTIRIEEEKPIQDTPIGESNLIRRRGVAFDFEGVLVASSDLTFSDNLNAIVNETKFRIKRNIQQGIIGVGTLNNQNIPEDDALKLAETTGANPLAISNIKAEANNEAANNINASSAVVSPTPVEMRTGNVPFQEAGGEPANIISNQSSPNKTIDPSQLIQQPFSEFIEENPSLKKMQDTFQLLQGASMSQLSDIMSEPGVFNLNGEELAEKLKNNIVSAINPNPEKIKEIKNKTTIWLEALKKQSKIDYEQLTLNMHPKQRAAFKTFEVYYEEIEQQELENWITFLLSKKYTEEEIQSGIREEELRDEYKIKFNVKGKKGRVLKVQVARRNERLRDKLNQ